MTVGILLAAGASTRLGRPKQWLPWGTGTLLEHVVQQLQQAGCDPALVVLGKTVHHDEQNASSLSDRLRNIAGVKLLYNHAWEQGQATSLRCGLQHATVLYPADNVLIALCDQPLIPVAHYAELVQTLNDSPLLAAATLYPQGAGVPVCLSPMAVRKLLTAAGDRGAKPWLRQLPQEQIRTIRCQQAVLDIDTAAGYAAAMREYACSDPSLRSKPN